MATYVNNLRLKEIATGDESGTWGTSTNTNLELIADALGSGTEAITTNADTHTTTVADGAADEGRALFLKYTGTLDSACTITLAPNTINKVWFIENATSGSQNIIISQGSGANITIGNGKVAAIFTDGAGGGAAVLDAFADLELSSTLSVAGATSFTGVTTHGDDVVSDTDSTDDLGTTGVRWANLWVDAVTATDTVTSASLVGALTGNASTATALETARTIGGTSFNGTANIAVALAAEATALETARTIGGTSFDGTANIAVALATLATTVTITDNESTNENNAIVFTAGGDIDGGNLGLESDGTLTYNPSTGKVTTTAIDTQTLVVDGISTLAGAVTASSTSTLTGNVSIGFGTKYAPLTVKQGAADYYGIVIEESASDGWIRMGHNGTVGAIHTTWNSSRGATPLTLGTSASVTQVVLNVDGSTSVGGALAVTGALSKGSGSFKIDHPLPAKADTHHLVHSFIEGPRADLIYRGVAALSGGSATVDLDEAAGMSAGTWELLCRDPQVWIQNDSGWAQVRGSVTGSTLTILCEDAASTDSVSWMVVAERCDPHIIETGWTDDDGRVIVEPPKVASTLAEGV